MGKCSLGELVARTSGQGHWQVWNIRGSEGPGLFGNQQVVCMAGQQGAHEGLRESMVGM